MSPGCGLQAQHLCKTSGVCPLNPGDVGPSMKERALLRYLLIPQQMTFGLFDKNGVMTQQTEGRPPMILGLQSWTKLSEKSESEGQWRGWGELGRLY